MSEHSQLECYKLLGPNNICFYCEPLSLDVFLRYVKINAYQISPGYVKPLLFQTIFLFAKEFNML